MPQIKRIKAKPAIAVLAVLLPSLVLVACGGSSTSSNSKTTATSAASTSPGTPGAGGSSAAGGRFAAVRECLQKQGITLPKRTPGQRRGPGGPGAGLLGGGGGAGRQLPKGVTRAQYEAALKKCGGSFRAGGGFAGRFKSPAFKAALVKFAACLREHGVRVGEPNTSGKGPVFNTAGINTASAQFKAAEASCGSILRTGAPGLAGGAGAGGAGAGGAGTAG